MRHAGTNGPGSTTLGSAVALALLSYLWLWPVLPAGAELALTTQSVNLGKIKGGVPVEQEFTFTVTGGAPVEIVELRPGCGCVRAQLDKMKFEPGDKGRLVFQVDTLGEAAGAHRWYVYLLYRQGQQEHQVALQVLAEVSNEVTVQPARLSIHSAGPVGHDIRLTDFRAMPLRITKVQTSASFLTATATGASQDGHGHWNSTIRLQMSDGAPVGRTEGRIDIYTDDPVYRHLQIPVVITRPAMSRLSAVPAKVKVLAARGQPVPSRLLVLRDAREEPVVVDRIETPHPALQVRWVPGPGTLATVKIVIDAEKFEGDRLETEIRLELSAPEKCTLCIPVNCLLEK